MANTIHIKTPAVVKAAEEIARVTGYTNPTAAAEDAIIAQHARLRGAEPAAAPRANEPAPDAA